MTCDEECIRRIVKEELVNFQSPKSPKKEKKKSQWNMFLSDCSKKYPKEMTIGDRAKACAIEYKEYKKNSKDLVPVNLK